MKKIAFIAALFMIVICVGMLAMRGNERDTEVTRKNTKVGVIYNGSIDDKGWGQSHYEGICKTKEALNLSILFYENVPFDETCMTTMQKLIDDGCEIIICNSFNYEDYIMQVAKDNPDVTFLHATGVMNDKNVATYFGRMYQMRYLCGIVAGMQTQNNEIGYVAAFPIDEVNRGINAFTLGVRHVNPQAVVNVYWSESWTDDMANTIAANTLIDEYDVDVITMHCDTTAPLDVAESRGIWSIGYNMDNQKNYPNSYLMAAVWNWEKFYTPQILKCLQGKFSAKHYWEGVETGIVGVSPFTTHVDAKTEKVVTDEMERLVNGSFDVFYGPVWDNEGNLRIREGENMPDEVLLNSFDWYVEGVNIHEE